MKLKLEDIAKKAGVSVATVSRVLNNKPTSESTRLNVEKVIADLHYKPEFDNIISSDKKSKRVGVIVSNMENPYFSAIMHSMDARFREEGFLCNFVSSSKRGNEEVDILKAFVESGVDGIIIADVGNREENSGLYSDINKQIPVILINGNPERIESNLINVDQAEGMRNVMDYLFSLNHEKIAFLRGSGSNTSDIKEDVYRDKMESKKYPVENNYIITIDDTEDFDCIESSTEEISKLLKSKNPPTAIFASNEILAMGVFRAAHEAELSIPDDISLIAHDNTFLSRLTIPHMSSVNMDPSKLGLEATEMMLQLLRSKKRSSRRLIFYPELVVRGTTKAI